MVLYLCYLYPYCCYIVVIVVINIVVILIIVIIDMIVVFVILIVVYIFIVILIIIIIRINISVIVVNIIIINICIQLIQMLCIAFLLTIEWLDWSPPLIQKQNYRPEKKPTYVNIFHTLTGQRPLSRYVKLRVAHAPGMPGTFSPPPTSKETNS